MEERKKERKKKERKRKRIVAELFYLPLARRSLSRRRRRKCSVDREGEKNWLKSKKMAAQEESNNQAGEQTNDQPNDQPNGNAESRTVATPDSFECAPDCVSPNDEDPTLIVRS